MWLVHIRLFKDIFQESNGISMSKPGMQYKVFYHAAGGVELYARVHREVKKMTLRWIFQLRVSPGFVTN
ncbi:hypothetical protein ES703_38754 [subsurface metagenome]